MQMMEAGTPVYRHAAYAPGPAGAARAPAKKEGVPRFFLKGRPDPPFAQRIGVCYACAENFCRSWVSFCCGAWSVVYQPFAVIC